MSTEPSDSPAGSGELSLGSEIPVEVEATSDGAAGAASTPASGATANALDDELAALKAKLALAEKDAKDLKDKWLRGAADLENHRKRAKRDVDDAKFDTKVKVLKEMLPVVDNLERALEHAGASKSEPGGESMIEGLRLVLRQFTTAFERLDVAPIVAEGQAFDPNLHEAIQQIETADAAPGTVMSVLQRGYRAGDKLLRPALVVVAKAKAE